MNKNKDTVIIKVICILIICLSIVMEIAATILYITGTILESPCYAGIAVGAVMALTALYVWDKMIDIEDARYGVGHDD